MEELISYKYSIPYIVFLCLMFLLLFFEFIQINNKQKKTLVRQLTIISFLAFFGLKGYIGRDIFNYYEFFQTMPTLWNWSEPAFSNSIFEVGYKYYTIIIKSLCPNFFFFIFVNTLTDVLLLDAIVKRHSKYYVLAFIVYIVFYGHIFEMEQIRNGKSVLLFFYSLRFIEEKKPFPYFLINIIGALFHFSAFIYLPLYFLLNRKMSKVLFLVFFIIGNILVVFGIEYIKPFVALLVKLTTTGDTQERLLAYLSDKIYASSFGLTIGYIERIITYSLVFFVFYDKLLKENKSNLLFINIYFLYFVSNFFFSEITIVVVRLSALFILSYTILIPNIYYEIKNIGNKGVFFAVLFVYLNFKFAAYHKYIEYKYENIIWSDIDYDKRKQTLRKANEYRLQQELKNTNK